MTQKRYSASECGKEAMDPINRNVHFMSDELNHDLVILWGHKVQHIKHRFVSERA